VTLDYSVADVWVRRRPGTEDDRPHVYNEGSAAARNIVVADLIIDQTVIHRFTPLEGLPAGGRAPIEPADREGLTQALSHSVVRQILSGRPITLAWSVRIDYEDWKGSPFVTTCEIQVWRFPLALHVANVKASSVAVPSERQLRRASGYR
jgi:hypothetical protein